MKFISFYYALFYYVSQFYLIVPNIVDQDHEVLALLHIGGLVVSDSDDRRIVLMDDSRLVQPDTNQITEGNNEQEILD